jgi:hypothetical protein
MKEFTVTFRNGEVVFSSGAGADLPAMIEHIGAAKAKLEELERCQNEYSAAFVREVAAWCEQEIELAKKSGRHVDNRPFVQNADMIICALRSYAATIQANDAKVRK